MTLAHRYKVGSLRMLLMRRLGRELGEGAALEMLDEIWHAMDPEERRAVDLWVRSLPESLRSDGPDVRDDWDRASGDVECPTCGMTYAEHPVDPRGDFLLHVACDGRRWKL